MNTDDSKLTASVDGGLPFSVDGFIEIAPPKKRNGREWPFGVIVEESGQGSIAALMDASKKVVFSMTIGRKDYCFEAKPYRKIPLKGAMWFDYELDAGQENPFGKYCPQEEKKNTPQAKAVALSLELFRKVQHDGLLPDEVSTEIDINELLKDHSMKEIRYAISMLFYADYTENSLYKVVDDFHPECGFAWMIGAAMDIGRYAAMDCAIDWVNMEYGAEKKEEFDEYIWNKLM